MPRTKSHKTSKQRSAARPVARERVSAEKKSAKKSGKKLRIGLVGFGTVGRSVAKLLSADHHDSLDLAAICVRNVQKKKVDWVPRHVRWTEKFDDLLSPDVDVVVELIGGLEPAGAWIRKSLRAGKSVVTANKQLIAEHGPELLTLAREKRLHLAFGASVAGGIPAIMGIQEGLAGDRLYKIAGILNGTCNYILTQMEAKGASFAAALAEAQKLGYAEADPTSDVEGFDARAKLIILAQAGLRVQARSEQILCRTISTIEAVDFVYARELHCTIRQISSVQKEKTKGSVQLFAAVQPALVPLGSLTAHVEGSKNLVTATGEFAGSMVFSGYGAGGDPTAVAVVSDLCSIARSAGAPDSAMESAAEVPASVSGDFTVPHYLRFFVSDRPGILAGIAAVLARYEIGIDAVLQKPDYPSTALPFVMTLEACNSAVLNRALEEIARLDFHTRPPLCLPIFLD